jgi:hypothetical protein
MAIGKGDQASMTWWNINFGLVDLREKEQLTEALLRYCELDTLDVVEIYRKLVDLISDRSDFLKRKNMKIVI